MGGRHREQGRVGIREPEQHGREHAGAGEPVGHVGRELARVAAVCPVLDPALTMQQMERGMPLYMRYFERKWRGSLQRSRWTMVTMG